MQVAPYQWSYIKPKRYLLRYQSIGYFCITENQENLQTSKKAIPAPEAVAAKLTESFVMSPQA